MNPVVAYGYDNPTEESDDNMREVDVVLVAAAWLAPNKTPSISDTWM